MNSKQTAEKLIKLLKDSKFHVLRYDSYSSSSVYIKPDAGLLGTIRIASHKGKSHLKYKYNVVVNKVGIADIGDARSWFSPENVDILVAGLIGVKESTQDKQKYAATLKSTLRKNLLIKPGFWSKCKVV